MRALRFDTNILYHPVLRRLRASERWVFLTLLYLAGESQDGRLVLFHGGELKTQDLADQAGVTLKEATKALERFLELGLVERWDGDLLLSSDWRRSSSSLERVRRYRRKVQTQKNDSLGKDVTVKRVTPALHASVTPALHRSVTSPLQASVTALHPQKEKANSDEPSAFSALPFYGGLGDVLGAKQSAFFDSFLGDLGTEKRGICPQESEQKEKEERTKEEREVFFIPEREKTPERGKEGESREGEKEETPSPAKGIPDPPLPCSLGDPSPACSYGEDEAPFFSPAQDPGTLERASPLAAPKDGKGAARSSRAREGKPDLPEPEAFARFWQAYPRKIAKEDARRAWRARIREKVKAEELVRAAENYARKLKREGTEERFILYPSTFLGPGRRWLDYLDSEPYISRKEERGGEDLNLLSL